MSNGNIKNVEQNETSLAKELRAKPVCYPLYLNSLTLCWLFVTKVSEVFQISTRIAKHNRIISI